MPERLLPDGSMWYRLAEPQDPDIDALDCGASSEAREVEAYFKSRRWFDLKRNRTKPPTYQFGVGDEVVGYAATDMRRLSWPSAAQPRARFLVIYVVGVHRRFQGRVNPRSPHEESYAANLFRALESGEDFARSRPDCVGLFLKVKSSNGRAIRFYEKLGFVAADPEAEPHLEMAKVWP